MSYAIEMLNITKDFPGIRANDDVTLQVEEKSIHALLGRKRGREIHADVDFIRSVSADPRHD